jgi:hypothetical protein
VVGEVAVDYQTSGRAMPTVFQVGGQPRGEAADRGGPVRVRAREVELRGQQGGRHVGERDHAGTLAPHLDSPGSSVVTGEQGADLLHRRLGIPPNLMAGDERNDLPQQALCDRPGLTAEGRQRARRGEAEIS